MDSFYFLRQYEGVVQVNGSFSYHAFKEAGLKYFEYTIGGPYWRTITDANRNHII
jgi:hypothetical protein